MSAKLTVKEFIERSVSAHGDKYDYSKSEYKSKDACVDIICPTHGLFSQTPNNHWKGKGCPLCSGNKKSGTDEFVKKAKEIHGDSYGYTKAEYINNRTHVTITCPKHGDFNQTPYKHLSGHGCPACGLDKRKETNIIRYGFPHPAQSEEVKKKSAATCMVRYGMTNAGWTKESREKIINTNIIKYGVPFVVASEFVRDKSKKTMQERYGVPYPLQYKPFLIKSMDTSTKRYGFPHPQQSPLVKQKTEATCMSVYGCKSPLLSDSVKSKSRQTMLCLYGCDNPAKSPAILKKISDTKRARGTFSTSLPEEKLYGMLICKFGKENIIRQFNSDKYPFACDFYITVLDLYIELNAGWMHGGHFFDPEKDADTLKSWEEKAKNSMYYKKAIETWTDRDIGKRDCAVRNKLNYVVFWDNSLKDAICWISKYDMG